MGLLLKLGSGFGLFLFKIILAIFSSSVVEKGMAVIAFKSMRWIAARTTWAVDNEVVKQMEVAYYGEEKYAQVFHRAAGDSADLDGSARKEPHLDLSGLAGSEHRAGGVPNAGSQAGREVRGPAGSPTKHNREARCPHCGAIIASNSDQGQDG